MKNSWKFLSLVSLGGVLESCTPLQKDINIHYLDAFDSPQFPRITAPVSYESSHNFRRLTLKTIVVDPDSGAAGKILDMCRPVKWQGEDGRNYYLSALGLMRLFRNTPAFAEFISKLRPEEGEQTLDFVYFLEKSLQDAIQRDNNALLNVTPRPQSFEFWSMPFHHAETERQVITTANGDRVRYRHQYRCDELPSSDLDFGCECVRIALPMNFYQEFIRYPENILDFKHAYSDYCFHNTDTTIEEKQQFILNFSTKVKLDWIKSCFDDAPTDRPSIKQQNARVRHICEQMLKPFYVPETDQYEFVEFPYQPGPVMDQWIDWSEELSAHPENTPRVDQPIQVRFAGHDYKVAAMPVTAWGLDEKESICILCGK